MIYFESAIRILRYFSIICLALGIIMYLKKFRESHHEIGIYLIILILFECFSKKVGTLLGNNLIIFLASSFFHFCFLTQIYFNHFFKIKSSWKWSLIAVGAIPFIMQSVSLYNIDTNEFQSYDRAAYDLLIVIYTLLIYLKIARQKIWTKGLLFLNGAILLFFGLDIFLAISTNFLINQSLSVVSWFWMLRAICLQLFYVSLIYYLWNNGKTQQHH